MKNLLLSLLLSCSLVGCADVKTIDGITYDTYGLFNEDEKRNPDIEYSLVGGNILWSVLLCETLVMPVYFFGFALYEPIGRKAPGVKGQVK